MTPPPQLKVAPGVADEAVSVSLVKEQERGVGAAMPAFGTVMFWVTEALAEAVQPLAVSVTVTV